jgi:hypothetical protein
MRDAAHRKPQPRGYDSRSQLFDTLQCVESIAARVVIGAQRRVAAEFTEKRHDLVGRLTASPLFAFLG